MEDGMAGQVVPQPGVPQIRARGHHGRQETLDHVLARLALQAHEGDAKAIEHLQTFYPGFEVEINEGHHENPSFLEPPPSLEPFAGNQRSSVREGSRLVRGVPTTWQDVEAEM